MIQDVFVIEADKKKKKVGEFHVSYNSFVSVRDSRKHLLRKYNAWAIDKKVVLKFLQPRKCWIVIVDTYERVIYSVTSEKFIHESGEVNFNQHNPQLYLNMELFEATRYSNLKLDIIKLLKYNKEKSEE